MNKLKSNKIVITRSYINRYYDFIAKNPKYITHFDINYFNNNDKCPECSSEVIKNDTSYYKEFYKDDVIKDNNFIKLYNYFEYRCLNMHTFCMKHTRSFIKHNRNNIKFSHHDYIFIDRPAYIY